MSHPAYNSSTGKNYIITFCVSRRQSCLSVCLSMAACPHYCTNPDVTCKVRTDLSTEFGSNPILIDQNRIGGWIESDLRRSDPHRPRPCGRL